MPTGMHFTYTRIYSEYAAGNHAEAQRLFQSLLPTLAFSNQHLDISVHFFKRLLYRQGLYATPQVREPILAFDAVHDEIATPLIDAVIALENSIENSMTD
jgi:4-hydroxy-tetrahydrodipicolinate synthase